jgi:hypothetical protein
MLYVQLHKLLFEHLNLITVLRFQSTHIISDLTGHCLLGKLRLLKQKFEEFAETDVIRLNH